MPFPAPSALAARWFVCLFSLLVVPFVTCANDKSVIIIGAGAAGLQAAVNLTASGWNVTILEARARIGGRVWTETITVPGVQGPVVLDYGAMWIHGDAQTTNPVTLLARAANLTIHYAGQDEAVSYWPGGREVNSQEAQAAQRQAADFVAWQDASRDELGCDERDTNAINTNLNTSLNAYIAQRKLSPNTTIVLQNTLNSDIVQEYAASLNNLSACWWDQGSEAQEDEDGWVGSTGYGKVLEGLVARGGVRTSIVLNTTVTGIDYSAATLAAMNGSIVVNTTTTDGQQKSYKAPYVLVTVPLGVLQRGNITFVPPLPAEKQGAIQRLGMGLLNKVFLVFPSDKVFWDKEAFWINRVVLNDSSVGLWTEFVSPYMYTKQPMLVAFIAGDQAITAEQTQPSLNTTVDQVLTALDTMYPGKVPDIDQLLYYGRYWWGQDPFTYGSYSFMRNGTNGTERAALAAPVSIPTYGPRLFFAGEAADSRFPATVHGALLSGQDAAAGILNAEE